MRGVVLLLFLLGVALSSLDHAHSTVDPIFGKRLPLEVMTILPESPSGTATLLDSSSALTVVFSRPVLPLGFPFDDTDPVLADKYRPFYLVDTASLNASLTTFHHAGHAHLLTLGSYRWITTYIARFDPDNGVWPSDLAFSLLVNPNLTTFDGFQLTHSAEHSVQHAPSFKTPSLSLLRVQVSSTLAHNASLGSWSSLVSSSALETIVHLVPPESDSLTVDQLDSLTVHEVPPDGLVHLYFSHPVSASFAQDFLHFSFPVPFSATPCSDDVSAHLAYHDSKRSENCLALSFSLPRTWRFPLPKLLTIGLREGSHYHPRAGPISPDASSSGAVEDTVAFVPLLPFRFWLTASTDDIRSVRFNLHLFHGLAGHSLFDPVTLLHSCMTVRTQELTRELLFRINISSSPTPHLQVTLLEPWLLMPGQSLCIAFSKCGEIRDAFNQSLQDHVLNVTLARSSSPVFLQPEGSLLFDWFPRTKKHKDSDWTFLSRPALLDNLDSHSHPTTSRMTLFPVSAHNVLETLSVLDSFYSYDSAFGTRKPETETPSAVSALSAPALVGLTSFPNLTAVPMNLFNLVQNNVQPHHSRNFIRQTVSDINSRWAYASYSLTSVTSVAISVVADEESFIVWLSNLTTGAPLPSCQVFLLTRLQTWPSAWTFSNKSISDASGFASFCTKNDEIHAQKNHAVLARCCLFSCEESLLTTVPAVPSTSRPEGVFVTDRNVYKPGEDIFLSFYSSFPSSSATTTNTTTTTTAMLTVFSSAGSFDGTTLLFHSGQTDTWSWKISLPNTTSPGSTVFFSLARSTSSLTRADDGTQAESLVNLPVLTHSVLVADPSLPTAELSLTFSLSDKSNKSNKSNKKIVLSTPQTLVLAAQAHSLLSGSKLNLADSELRLSWAKVGGLGAVGPQQVLSTRNATASMNTSHCCNLRDGDVLQLTARWTGPFGEVVTAQSSLNVVRSFIQLKTLLLPPNPTPGFVFAILACVKGEIEPETFVADLALLERGSPQKTIATCSHSLFSHNEPELVCHLMLPATGGPFVLRKRLFRNTVLVDQEETALESLLTPLNHLPDSPLYLSPNSSNIDCSHQPNALKEITLQGWNVFNGSFVGTVLSSLSSPQTQVYGPLASGPFVLKQNVNCSAFLHDSALFDVIVSLPRDINRVPPLLPVSRLVDWQGPAFQHKAFVLSVHPIQPPKNMSVLLHLTSTYAEVQANGSSSVQADGSTSVPPGCTISVHVDALDEDAKENDSVEFCVVVVDKSALSLAEDYYDMPVLTDLTNAVGSKENQRVFADNRERLASFSGLQHSLETWLRRSKVDPWMTPFHLPLVPSDWSVAEVDQDDEVFFASRAIDLNLERVYHRSYSTAKPEMARNMVSMDVSSSLAPSSSSSPVVKTRSKFAKVAWFEPNMTALFHNHTATARLDIVLPDNLATWVIRVFAVRSNGATNKFAQDGTQIVTRQPLQLQARFPRLVRENDLFFAEVAAEVTSDVSLPSSGPQLVSVSVRAPDSASGYELIPFLSDSTASSAVQAVEEETTVWPDSPVMFNFVFRVKTPEAAQHSPADTVIISGRTETSRSEQSVLRDSVQLTLPAVSSPLPIEMVESTLLEGVAGEEAVHEVLSETVSQVQTRLPADSSLFLRVTRGLLLKPSLEGMDLLQQSTVDLIALAMHSCLVESNFSQILDELRDRTTADTGLQPFSKNSRFLWSIEDERKKVNRLACWLQRVCGLTPWMNTWVNKARDMSDIEALLLSETPSSVNSHLLFNDDRVLEALLAFGLFDPLFGALVDPRFGDVSSPGTNWQRLWLNETLTSIGAHWTLRVRSIGILLLLQPNSSWVSQQEIDNLATICLNHVRLSSATTAYLDGMDASYSSTWNAWSRNMDPAPSLSLQALALLIMRKSSHKQNPVLGHFAIGLLAQFQRERLSAFSFASPFDRMIVMTVLAGIDAAENGNPQQLAFSAKANNWLFKTELSRRQTTSSQTSLVGGDVYLNLAVSPTPKSQVLAESMVRWVPLASVRKDDNKWCTGPIYRGVFLERKMSLIPIAGEDTQSSHVFSQHALVEVAVQVTSADRLEDVSIEDPFAGGFEPIDPLLHPALYSSVGEHMHMYPTVLLSFNVDKGQMQWKLPVLSRGVTVLTYYAVAVTAGLWQIPPTRAVLNLHLDKWTDLLGLSGSCTLVINAASRPAFNTPMFADPILNAIANGKVQNSLFSHEPAARHLSAEAYASCLRTCPLCDSQTGKCFLSSSSSSAAYGNVTLVSISSSGPDSVTSTGSQQLTSTGSESTSSRSSSSGRNHNFAAALCRLNLDLVVVACAAVFWLIDRI